jgi:hypothetical protein
MLIDGKHPRLFNMAQASFLKRRKDTLIDPRIATSPATVAGLSPA